MAAALRHAARRIGTQAAAAAAEQRLPAGLRGLDEKKKDAVIRLIQIQQKKEELYSLIDGWKAEYTSSGPFGIENNRLLNQLSVQVKPRHDDPRWRSCRRWAIAGECFKYAGGFFIAKMAGDGLTYLYRKVQHPSEQ